jgi:hypothetical protein
MALVVAASKPTSAKICAAISRMSSILRWPRACRRRDRGIGDCSIVTLRVLDKCEH